jgi:hypothetical protein
MIFFLSKFFFTKSCEIFTAKIIECFLFTGMSNLGSSTDIKILSDTDSDPQHIPVPVYKYFFSNQKPISAENPSVAELIEKMFGTVRDCQLDILQVSIILFS